MGVDCQYEAEVISIYDGDTPHLAILLGLGVTMTGSGEEGERCRMTGINAPELRSTGGPAAKAALEDLIPPGSLVTIHTPNDARDDYGRPLVSIRRSDGVNVNQAMLDAGQAVPLGPYAP